jgi:MoaA/NifB/PqqE/SkfB family radical SAM enzyme
MKEEKYKNLTKRISQKGAFPYSVMFEITERCNLGCKFCYLGRMKNTESDMPIKKVFNLIDQLEEAGCMEVILLGGEPLIRKDFSRIYKYIKQKGMLVTIWTNGTLITPRIADLFKKYLPHHLRISIYAGSYEGYEKIAGNGDAFKLLKRDLMLLKKRNVYFSLRTVLTKLNFSEFENMKEFAESLGVKFWARTCITSTASREFNPKKFKVTPEQIDILKTKFEKYIPWKFEERSRKKLEKQGCNGCLHIANDGHLLACVLYRKRYNYDLEKMSLREAWQKRLSRKIKLKCPSI